MNTPGRDTRGLLTGTGEMGALILAHDWSRTELGPLETWPQSLWTAVDVCLHSRFAMVVFWGKSLVTLYNDAYRPSFGAKHPRVLGAPAVTLWPEAWHLLGPMIQGVIESGIASWAEDQFLLMDRSGFVEETYWTFSYSPIRGDGGTIDGIFTAVSETTSRVLGERRLRTLRALATETSRARSVPDAVRATTEVLATNPRDLPFARIYLGERHRLLLQGAPGAASDPAVLDGALLRVLERAEPERVEDASGTLGTRHALALPIAPPGQPGAAGVLLVGLSPELRLDEEYRGFLGLVAGQLATALSTAQAHEEERKRAESLAALDRAKTEFFNNVSHEFRTPLTLILGPVEEGLADTAHPLPPIQHERQQLVHRNGLRLLKLVNTLLDFSRIEAGRAQASYVPVDLARLTADLASAFRSTLEKAGLRLTVDCAPLPGPVWVDRELWEKVVFNLLSNAFKFTYQGEIALSVRARGERAELSVRDTGTGIPPEELGRIFERFHRVKGSRGRSYEGSGIGLSLVRELVRLHGGEVRVESTPGEGSVFTVSLPLGHAHLAPERLERDVAQASTSIGARAYVQEAEGWLGQELEPLVAPSPPDPRAPQGRLLLADDNADMREYVRRLLEGAYTVETVENGTRALAAARAHPPDLVLTDVMMPGLDGFGLLSALKADPRTAWVPVILLSARAGEEAKVEGLRAGADDYLVKPFGARELVARVEGAMRTARSQEQLRLRADFERQLIGIVSHDLRTPLSTILLGTTALLRRAGPSDAKQAQSLGRIQSSAERMSRLIRDLLDFTQARLGGGLRIERQAMDLRVFLQGARVELEAAYPGRELRLSCEGDGRGDWDPDRLGQLVQNLVTNALKYSPQDTPVLVQMHAGTDEVVLSIHNEGPPIPPERLGSIFQPLERAAHEVDNASRSIGLGLYIVRQVVDAHGGSVAVRSAAGEGTTFTVHLPRHP